MARRSDIGSKPSEEDAARQQQGGGLGAQSLEPESAPVEPCDTGDRFPQSPDHDPRQHPGGQRAAYPVPGPAVEKRAADKTVTSTHEFGHFDLGSPVLYVEADGIADDGHDTQPQKPGREQHATTQSIQDRV